MQNYYIRVFLLLCTINIASIAFSSDISAEALKTRRSLDYLEAWKHYERHVEGCGKLSYIRHTALKYKRYNQFFSTTAAVGLGLMGYDALYHRKIGICAVIGGIVVSGATLCQDIFDASFGDHFARVVDLRVKKDSEKTIFTETNQDVIDVILTKNNYPSLAYKPYYYYHTRLANYVLNQFGLGRIQESVRKNRLRMVSSANSKAQHDLQESTARFFGAQRISDLLVKSQE